MRAERDRGAAIRRLAHAFCVDDVRALACRRLPASVFGYLEGGADDEVTVGLNRAAFADWSFLPRCLVDVTEVDPSVEVLGSRLALPLMLGPTGLTRMFHPHGERAVARAAADAGLLYALSTMGSTTIEDLAAVGPSRRCFQIYAFRDRGLVREFIHRARAADYGSLCLTVDVPVFGQRERDLRAGLTLPPRIGARSAWGALRRPAWTWRYLSSAPLTLANVSHRATGRPGGLATLSSYVSAQFSPAVQWSDVEWMLGEWNAPFAIKGLLHRDDVRRAADAGVDCVLLSNHGGRQLDGAASPLTALARLDADLLARIDVIVDGGVRRGTDVVKALALGARACSIGRPYLYGLAAAGEAGVRHVLRLLDAEIRRAMALLGATRVTDLRRDLLERVASR